MARGSSPAPPPVPELPPDDVIREILLRLPPHPACLRRVSLVCKHWRRLVRDPAFLARLRAHHRHDPPVLGFYERISGFIPAGDPPDRVAAAHFSQLAGGRWRVLGCRHGRVLYCTRLVVPLLLLVWDPMTGARTCIAAPQYPRLATNIVIRGALLCGADGHDQDCAGDDCRSGPFRVIYFFPGKESDLMYAAVYSSETDAWGDLVPVTIPSLSPVIGTEPSVLVGNALYWLTCWHQERKIVGFQCDTNKLHLFEDLPRDSGEPYGRYQFIKARYGGLLGIAALRGLHLHMFELTLNSESSMTWVEYRSVDLATVLPPSVPIDSLTLPMEMELGFDEDMTMTFLKIRNGIFALRLKNLDVTEVLHDGAPRDLMIPYKSFYSAGDSSCVDDDA
ncbi:hypothetical protein ACP70R_020675 [Stipagrostis hirtigluma subsp. patula]